MEPIKSILAPVDFSAPSNLAFETAVGLAKSLNADLHILHAFEAPGALFDSYAISIPEPLISEARDVVARKLEKSCQMAIDHGVSVDSHLGTAPAASAIVDLSEDLGVDLIIMGTRGHSDLAHVLIGSVAERTLRRAPCSVLIVKASSG
jgi:nucleotide-binding universal stress UspA family protein